MRLAFMFWVVTSSAAFFSLHVKTVSAKILKSMKRIAACVIEAMRGLSSQSDTVTEGLVKRSGEHNWPRARYKGHVCCCTNDSYWLIEVALRRGGVQEERWKRRGSTSVSHVTFTDIIEVQVSLKVIINIAIYLYSPVHHSVTDTVRQLPLNTLLSNCGSNCHTVKRVASQGHFSICQQPDKLISFIEVLRLQFFTIFWLENINMCEISCSGPSETHVAHVIQLQGSAKVM